VRGFLRLLWMALLLITVALVSALITMRIAVHGREVQVPDVQGRTPSDAKRMAEALGLALVTEHQYYSANVPEGKVLSQTPAPSAVVRRGWSIRVALSLGPQRVTIPQVVGESQRAAAIILQQRALDNSVAEINLPGAAAGQVLAQDPPANASDVTAPKVNLLVAQEPAPEAYVMPSFVGRPLGSVMLSIKDAGFTLAKVTVAPPATTTATVETNPIASAGNSGASPTTPAPSATLQPGVPPNVSAAVPSPASIVISHQPAAGEKIVAASNIRLIVR
jgi:eukaryotic-like serine/threonine-protein kinase